MTNEERLPIDPATFPVCPTCETQHIRREVLKDAGEVWYATCTGHRRNGMCCKKYPMEYRRVCKLHGAASPAAVRSAEELRIADEIRKTMASELVNTNPTNLKPHHTNPIQGLLWEVGMSAQAVEWLALQIADLTVPRPEEFGPLRDVVGVDDQGNEVRAQGRSVLWGATRTGELGVHVLYEMWSDERDRHARLCLAAVRAGVSERMVAIAETQAAALVRVITAIIDNTDDTTAAQRAQMRTIAAAQLRTLGSGGIAAADAGIPVN